MDQLILNKNIIFDATFVFVNYLVYNNIRCNNKNINKGGFENGAIR